MDIVGFAVRPATATSPWRQIGLSEGTDFRATWRVSPPAAAVTVVATACLGGGSPTEVVDARTLPGGKAGLSRSELAAAARSACQYPRT